MIIKNFTKKELKKAQDIVAFLRMFLKNPKCQIIGSAAIPMIGKREIDILVISNNIKKDFQSLKKYSYTGIILKNKAYMRKRIGEMTYEIHLVKPESEMIGVYARYIKILKSDHKLRKKYEILKRACKYLTEEGYKTKKSEFIRKNIVSKSTEKSTRPQL